MAISTWLTGITYIVAPQQIHRQIYFRETTVGVHNGANEFIAAIMISFPDK